MSPNHEELANVIETFKQLAKELNVTVITATQPPPPPGRSSRPPEVDTGDIIFIDYVGLLR